MDRYTNYDAFKALHEARLQRARASAVAAGFGHRERVVRSPLRSAARHFANRRAIAITPSHSPETMLWA
ncbi:MAG: hypothetical protein OES13_04640 [Acidimicrobiia bacterium]|nr:hypothetical protein [Acidimicrobiia bacterium]